MIDDPINPTHYAGRSCADIGERLTGNGYQILKYVWRLGKKDAPAVDLGKAAWYAESEISLLESIFKASGVAIRTAPLALGLIDAEEFFRERVCGQPGLTRAVARALWCGYDAGDMRTIHALLVREREEHAGS